MSTGFSRLLGEDYQVVDIIGQGGTGILLEAVQHSMDRSVAVKVLQSDLLTDPEFRDRFEREAKSIARLTHANIVHVYDFIRRDDQLAIVMQYVDGGALSTRMRGDGLAGRDALRILGCVAHALDYAHDRGALHRDVKPQNVLLQADGPGVWLADFGLVKLVDGTALTRTQGKLMGTYPYMAPEVLRGEPATPASDLYAFAATAYQVLAGGGYPFPGSTGLRARDPKRRSSPPVPLLPADDATAAVVEILARGLAPDPADRPGRATQLVDELAAALDSAAAQRSPAFTQDLQTQPLASWDVGKDLDDEETLLDVAPAPASAAVTPAPAPAPRPVALADEPELEPELAPTVEPQPIAVDEPEPASVAIATLEPEVLDQQRERQKDEHEDLAEPATAAAGTTQPRRSRRPLVLVSAAAVLASGVAAAVLLGDQGDDPAVPRSTPPATLRAGAASFQAPAGTAPSAQAKAIADRAFPGLQPAALAATGTAAAGIALALLDEGRVQLTPAATAKGRTITVAGGRARRYQRAATTTVVAQTSSQVVRLACTAASPACDRAIATLSLGEEQLQADPLADVAAKLRAGLQKPRSSRERLPLPRLDLTSRKDRARSIAKAYREARAAVEALAKARQRDRDLPLLAERLTAAASAYTQIADAAGNRSTPGDRRGRRALALADAQLRSSRTVLESRGYDLAWPTTTAPSAVVIKRRTPTTTSSSAGSTSTATDAGGETSSPSTATNPAPSGSGGSSSSSSSSGNSGSNSFCDTGPC